VGTVRTSSPHFTAWQRYLSTGPLALLPLWDGYSAFVWSLPIMEARRISSLPSEEFLVALNSALQSPTQNDRWSVLEPGDAPFPRPIRELASLVDAALSAALLAQASGSGSSSSTFQQPPIVTEMSCATLAFPLQLQQASEYTAARIALAGDAAHSIHPQAGQGLNLGLEDARVLASAVAGALGTGGDIGDPVFLRRSYGAPQYAANLAMIGAVDAINGVFSYSGRGAGMLNILRGAGMLAVNSLGTVKTHLAAKAMGRSKK
jgi:ubiquinone biosynthesis monooxygenase Coq6